MQRILLILRQELCSRQHWGFHGALLRASFTPRALLAAVILSLLSLYLHDIDRLDTYKIYPEIFRRINILGKKCTHTTI